MRAIMDKAGVDSKAGTIVFSLPVTSTAGLRILEDSQDEEVNDETIIDYQMMKEKRFCLM